MENHPIEVWDHLVCKNLYPEKLKNDKQDKVDDLLDESKKAREQLRLHLIKEAFQRKSEQEYKVLIGQYQSYLSNYLHTIENYLSNVDISVEHRSIYHQVANDLSENVKLLENTFPDYFDQNKNAPFFLVISLEKDWKAQLNALRSLLTGQEKDRELFDFLIDTLENILHRPGNEITFHLISYIKKFISFLAQREWSCYTNSKYGPLIELLIEYKFNDDKFLKILFRHLSCTIYQEGADAQLFHAKEYYKCTAQIQEAACQPLYRERDSAKELILCWLTEEIHFIETSLPKQETVNSSLTKINTSLSVPLLALYIRLFKDSGIITNTNYQELFRAVCSAFTTHRNVEPAHGHLHAKFYSVDETAKRKVFDQLMDMARLCKKLD